PGGRARLHEPVVREASRQPVGHRHSLRRRRVRPDRRDDLDLSHAGHPAAYLDRRSSDRFPVCRLDLGRTMGIFRKGTNQLWAAFIGTYVLTAIGMDFY